MADEFATVEQALDGGFNVVVNRARVSGSRDRREAEVIADILNEAHRLGIEKFVRKNITPG